MSLIAAVAVLPLMHITEARAGSYADGQTEKDCVDVCDHCPCCPESDDTPCCPSDELPENPASNDDQPCDCPCCGKVLPVVPMITSLLMGGPFWADAPTTTTISRSARPESTVVSVDIQPPIV